MFEIIILTALVASSWSLYSPLSSVITLNPTNFNKLILEGDEIWIVEFFAPWCGHCQALVPEYTKAASALKGVVKLGAVNADEHKDIASVYGVRAFPTIKIFGANKNDPEEYNGARTAQGLVEAALGAVKTKVESSLNGKSSNSDVIELTDSNFDLTVLESEDMWMVEFFAPWCGYCKSLAPHWAEAAARLKGKVKLGALDATVHRIQSTKYKVQGFPTIKVFAAGKKTRDSVSQYDGDRTSEDIVKWALEKLVENLPTPDVTEITDQNSFALACEGKALCVLAFLPHILDCQSECRNTYLGILKQLGDKYKKNGWGWIWCEAGSQPELESALGVGGFGYPAMVVISLKKMKYSVLRGAFSINGINEFFRDLSYGRGISFNVKGQRLPKVVAVEPWDGKDADFPQEEETDLSDVQLDDKDEL